MTPWAGRGAERGGREVGEGRRWRVGDACGPIRARAAPRLGAAWHMARARGASPSTKTCRSSKACSCGTAVAAAALLRSPPALLERARAAQPRHRDWWQLLWWPPPARARRLQPTRKLCCFCSCCRCYCCCLRATRWSAGRASSQPARATAGPARALQHTRGAARAARESAPLRPNQASGVLVEIFRVRKVTGSKRRRVQKQRGLLARPDPRVEDLSS